MVCTICRPVTILPFYMKRRGAEHGVIKKKGKVKSWDSDIICIRKSRRNKCNGGNIIYPRGEYRSYLAQTHLLKHSIPTNFPPNALPPQRTQQAWAGSVRDEIHAAGVIDESTSPWTFHIVPVHKTDVYVWTIGS